MGTGGLILLLIGAVAVAGVARRFRASAPLVLVAAGLVASAMVPGPDRFELEPDLVLSVVLPPLLFSAAWQSSYVSLRQNLRPIGLLSVGLVLFSALAVGLVVYGAVPDLPFAAALAFGAIVAPPDAVAATAIARSAGLPRRVTVILAGESLLNDATALTVYRVAAVAAVDGVFSAMDGLVDFAVAAIGGVLLGWVLAELIGRLLAHVSDATVENALLLATPFAAYALAESGPVHVSGVLAVVVCGLVLGHRAPRRQSFATRMQGTEIWRMTEFLLESVVFALIGLQLPAVLRDLADDAMSPGRLVSISCVVLVAAVLARFLWVYPATYLPRLIPAVRRVDPAPRWQYPAVIAWAGMRGVVSLAAAFALPAGFPERELLVLLTFVVVVGTLLLQGTTLGPLIRRLRLSDDDSGRVPLAEAAAHHEATGAALEWLTATAAERAGDPVRTAVAHALRDDAERHRLDAWERLGSDPHGTPSGVYRRLRLDMLGVERRTVLEMRDDGRIDDEVLRRVQRDLDIVEAALTRD